MTRRDKSTRALRKPFKEQLIFELDKYDRKLHTDEPAVPDGAYQPAVDIREMSLLFWVEHCVECAAPSCYQSCDLYQPRVDGRCRRFAYGAFKNTNFPSLRGYGVEVSFKQWAKIEAYGNVSMHPARQVLRRERMVERAAPLGNALGRLMATVTKKTRWNSATLIALEELARRQKPGKSINANPDAFLLEVYNPGAEIIRLQLMFRPIAGSENAKKQLVQVGPSFATTVALPIGYSRHEIDASLMRSVIQAGRPFSISMAPEADNNARLVFLSADFVRFAERVRADAEEKQIKCVVWDLDNTLWKGVLIEGDKVAVEPESRRILEQLDQRGILLSVATKNDRATAMHKLEELELSDYFLYPQINWRPKSESMRAIAERLNIGLDSMALVDDNPFELEQVRHSLPEVLVVNAEAAGSILSDRRFQGSSSAESRQRRQFYREAIAREEAQHQYGDNYTGFLASSGIVLTIAQYSDEDFERVAELVQRTNQLNFSGHKYTRKQLDEIVTDPRLDKYVLKSSDNYGTYGTVGFSIVEQATGIIQVRDFMLSCRVQGRFIEQAFFHHLANHHNPDAARTIWINFLETSRNKPAQQVLETLGFRKSGVEPDRLLEGMVHTSADSLSCDFIQVRCSASPGAPTVESGGAADFGRHPASGYRNGG